MSLVSAARKKNKIICAFLADQNMVRRCPRLPHETPQNYQQNTTKNRTLLRKTPAKQLLSPQELKR
jgi:hypothetical protein